MSQSITWLSYTVLITFVLLIILAGYMMIDAYTYKQKLRRIDRYIDQYKAQCYDYFINARTDEKVVPQNEAQQQAIAHTIENYIAFVKDDDVLHRIYRYADENYRQPYQKMLNGRSAPKRLNVLHRIFQFKMVSLLPDVKRLLAKRHLARRERMEGLKIVASLDELSAYQFYEAYKTQLHDGEIDTIVSCMSDDMIYQIVELAHEDDAWLLAALKSMQRRQLQHGEVAVNRLLQHPNREIQLEAVKMLTIIGTIKPLRDFESLFLSDDPSERQLFAQMAVHYPIHETYPYMYTLAQDRVFEVRTEAVKSLTYYANHQSIFKHMLQSLEDTYTKETIRSYMSGELVSDGVR